AYALLQGPVGMQIESTSGDLTFVPNDSQLGEHRVQIQVQDGQGGHATQAFDLIVRSVPNEAPSFTSTPLTEATVGKGYFYRPAATDADDAFAFELATGPSGMVLNRISGLIEFTPTMDQLGSHSVTIQAIDERGAVSEQSFELDVASDTTAPTVSILLSVNVVEPGTEVGIRVTAADDVGLTGLQLTRDGIVVPLDSNGLTTFSPTAPGLYKFLATATDSVGNVGTTEAVLRVIDPTDQTPPDVQLTSPAPGDSIGYLTDIVGSVLADDLEFYRIDFAPTELIDLDDFAADNSAWTTLAESTQQTIETTITQFDPTSLPNGEYLLRIFAQDFSGNADVKAVPVTVDGPAKLGQFSLEFVDLSIPLAGLPIEVTRTYSTLDSDKPGDFGFGWSLGAYAAEIRETVAPGTEDEVGIFGQTAFVHGTRVYITNPDGERIGFTFEPERTPSFFGQAYTPKFTPDPGVRDQLSVDPITLSQQSDGTYVAFIIGFPYNPSNYQLTRPDGTAYQYSETAGLQTVSDRNGNQLTYTRDGISHSSGESVQFVRDDLGRIAEIIDPDGNTIHYAYDDLGNLTSVEDQAKVATQFSYFTEPTHFLMALTAHTGELLQRTVYD
ncbi:MAG: putative Ig domain-containing protein, partial [Planctomycetota bacterium]